MPGSAASFRQVMALQVGAVRIYRCPAAPGMETAGRGTSQDNQAQAAAAW